MWSLFSSYYVFIIIIVGRCCGAHAVRGKRGVLLVRSPITTESVGTPHVTLLLSPTLSHAKQRTSFCSFSFIQNTLCRHENLVRSFLWSFLSLFPLLPFCLSLSLFFCPASPAAVYSSLTAAARRCRFNHHFLSLSLSS